MNQIKERVTEKEESNSLFFIVIYLFLIISLSIFVSNMLFGKNSFKKYQDLKKDKKILSKKIEKIKQNNAALQREYFELKSIIPQEDEENE